MKRAALSLLAAVSAGPIIAASPEPAAWAQDNAMAEVTVSREPVADGVHVLYGRGGNIGLTVGNDGAVLVDDQYAPLTERILAAVKEVTDRPIRFVINTHWHGDHTGGNENLGKRGATIVAHDNVHKRLANDQVMDFLGNKREVPASPEAARPVVTFNDQMALRLNGDTVRIHHAPHAHTDGDSLIHFQNANVIHMGDLFFESGYPFIDISSGGDLDGIIAGVRKGLALGDANTRYIPGHGRVTGREGLSDYLAMLEIARERVAKLMAEGKTLAQIQAAKPMSAYDAEWGDAFIKPDQFLSFVYVSLQ